MKGRRAAAAALFTLGMLVTVLLPATDAQAAPPTPSPDAAMLVNVPPENNCAEMKEVLKELAERGDKRGIICHEERTPSKALRSKARELVEALAEPIPFPSWCIDNATGNWEFWHRRLACQYRDNQVEILYAWRNNVLQEVGRAWLVLADLAAINPNDPTWQHQQQIIPFRLEGQASAGMTVAGGFSCEGWCLYGGQNYSRQPLAINTVVQGVRDFFTTVSTSGQVGEITTRLDVAFGKPGFVFTPVQVFAPKVRCDNAVPGVTTVGCVFPQYIPTMDYSLSGPYPGLARHLQKAQESGLPGAPGGLPLNRMTDETLRDRNGTTACPAAWPRPNGLDCDEYPFRSTVQGAYTAWSYTPDNPATPPRRPWPARTHDGCGSPAPPVPVFTPGVDPTSPNGYSVCFIPLAQNRGGGAALNANLYVAERVINGDAFYVEILP